ncbi:MAG: response regulator [Gammaproteobacteria bacterium]|nr:response regulator [Gammaproteobacteria bacterium]
MNSIPTIFVVDDDPAVRDSLQWLLESAGHQVVAYSSAEGFIDALEQNDCDCDCHFDFFECACLVLDLQMLGMDGLELQRFLASRCPCLPVIFISGHADERQIEQAMSAGAVVFLTKPFNDEQLLEHIRQALQPR